MDLTSIRKNIDTLDSMIITLLAKRQDFVWSAGKLKKDRQGVRDQQRVEQVIERVRARASASGLSPEIAERVYRTIIDCFIDRELMEFNGRNKKKGA